MRGEKSEKGKIYENRNIFKMALQIFKFTKFGKHIFSPNNMLTSGIKCCIEVIASN